ncbi:MAG: hypothetical protein J1F41_08690 [Lachnospiraceae bacterium]|nr:hypothetical protein [Lachnospiraceae bacterium]
MMKTDIKTVLEEAFAAPEPTRKKEFLTKMEQPRISTFTCLLSQISYIRKRVWLVSFLLLATAVWSVGYVGADCIHIISALIPFIALCTVTESARSTAYGMTELEMASRFSIKSIMLARLGAIGMLHLLILCILIPFVAKTTMFSYLQVGVYLSVPYFIVSVLGLMAVRKLRGKEAFYVSMGISVMASYLNLLGKESFPGLYEEKRFIWWCVALIYLIGKTGSEYKQAIHPAEAQI